MYCDLSTNVGKTKWDLFCYVSNVCTFVIWIIWLVKWTHTLSLSLSLSSLSHWETFHILSIGLCLTKQSLSLWILFYNFEVLFVFLLLNDIYSRFKSYWHTRFQHAFLQFSTGETLNYNLMSKFIVERKPQKPYKTCESPNNAGVNGKVRLGLDTLS